ncbi:hypothetical protein Tco_1275502 [Tanacetum coccineum]
MVMPLRSDDNPNLSDWAVKTGSASLAHLLSETIPNTPKFLPFPTNPITFAIAAIGFVVLNPTAIAAIACQQKPISQSHQKTQIDSKKALIFSWEDVESHPHSQETWNEVTPVKRGNTHEAGKSSDLIFVLTGIPSTPYVATSYPPDAVSTVSVKMDRICDLACLGGLEYADSATISCLDGMHFFGFCNCLQMVSDVIVHRLRLTYCKSLSKAEGKLRARDKELCEETKEENRKKYEECVDNEGRNGERSECKDC